MLIQSLGRPRDSRTGSTGSEAPEAPQAPEAEAPQAAEAEAPPARAAPQSSLPDGGQAGTAREERRPKNFNCAVETVPGRLGRLLHGGGWKEAGARSEARRGRGAQGAGEGDAAGLPVAEWRELRGQSPVGAPHAADREGGQAVRSRMSHREGCGTIRSHRGL